MQWILRAADSSRLLESLMSHGVALVTTSNRHPDDLYKNGIQRESFIPCINLLKTALDVINLNSPTDYRKIPRPPSGVYHHPLGEDAERHAQKWFEFLGDPINDPPHATTQEVWGRKIEVPLASGRAAQFSFNQLIGRATLHVSPDDLLSWTTRLGARYMGADRAEEFGRRNAVPEEFLVRVRIDKVNAVADISD